MSSDSTDARTGYTPPTRSEPLRPAVANLHMTVEEFESTRYKMNHSRRGVAVIINNKKFDGRTLKEEREGTDEDEEEMYELFDTLRFEKIFLKRDATVEEMRDVLTEAAKYDYSDSDCFVCVILSHGEEGYVYGRDDRISVDELLQPFKGNSTLAAKPKLFFIQACKERGETQGDAIGEAEESLPEMKQFRIPIEADFLVAYSVIPGYYSWGCSSTPGSWLIQAIGDVFTKNWKELDVLTMLTRVNKKVAQQFESSCTEQFLKCRKQLPCITSTLSKELYFEKK